MLLIKSNKWIFHTIIIQCNAVKIGNFLIWFICKYRQEDKGWNIFERFVINAVTTIFVYNFSSKPPLTRWKWNKRIKTEKEAQKANDFYRKQRNCLNMIHKIHIPKPSTLLAMLVSEVSGRNGTKLIFPVVYFHTRVFFFLLLFAFIHPHSPRIHSVYIPFGFQFHFYSLWLFYLWKYTVHYTAGLANM